MLADKSFETHHTHQRRGAFAKLGKRMRQLGKIHEPW
jgi:hypothetical protein